MMYSLENIPKKAIRPGHYGRICQNDMYVALWPSLPPFLARRWRKFWKVQIAAGENLEKVLPAAGENFERAQPAAGKNLEMVLAAAGDFFWKSCV